MDMTAGSALDDQTTGAIRRALFEAGAGRLPNAVAIGEQALCDGGDETALNAMLGMLRTKIGDYQRAVPHLRIAHRALPSDAAIASNLVMALVECGSLDEALAIASAERAATDASLQLARYRGYISQLQGQGAQAVKAYEGVVSAAPDDWQSWNNLGNARLSTEDYEGAVAAFKQSLDLNANVTLTWNNFAQALIGAGHLDEAESTLRSIVERFPDDGAAYKRLYLVMRERGRSPEDIADFLQRAAKAVPDDKDLLLAACRQRMILGDFAGAEAVLRGIIAADPRHSDAFLELAKIYEHEHSHKLDGLVAEAEAASVPSPTLDVLRAYAHRRSKDFAGGLAALKGVPNDFEPWLINDLRGQFLDKLGQPDAAFDAFARMNEAHAADASDPLASAGQMRSTLSDRLHRFTSDWVAGWRRADVPADRPSPVFLVGFPRSGTTLLDTMLMGHPDVSVMEEAPALDAVSREIGGFAGVAALDEDGLQRARDVYFDVAGKVAMLDRKVLIDKNPLHLAQVALIQRLFPDARYILAVRHPADVILSCYFSNFRITPALANFLRLDTAAEYYDLILQLWERGREVFDPDVQTVRYEKLVEDSEAELRPIVAALGLDWRADMLDHQTTAAARGVITSASYAQVTEPIYSSSVNRWERYREHLEPILPTLRPWIEKFGYTI